MAIDNIPDFFVFNYQGYDVDKKDFLPEAKKELETRIQKLDEGYYAVRSSSVNEDSSDNSFAGQFETYLYVNKKDILEKVKLVCSSVFSDRIETYKKENKIDKVEPPSVVVQKQINSEKSGVAFGANPVNGSVKEIVISSVYGLGSGLVDGIATADTYTIVGDEIQKDIVTKDYMHELTKGKVEEVTVDDNKKTEQVLSDTEITQVADLVKKSSDYFGRYQDIEWSIENDQLYLLQSRPITTLGNGQNQIGKINLFDNSNIVESYGGITTPLTFSFIRNVYENVYKELCRIFKIDEQKIEMNSQMFQSLLALIDGRVYYNLYGWYGILTMFPGLGSNKKFMESMMGVKESLPDDLFPVPQTKFSDKIGMLRAGIGLASGFAKLRRMTKNFYKRLNEALEDKDLEDMDLYELHDYYYDLESKLLNKWDAPLVNDFLVMIFYGQLKAKCNSIFQTEGDRVHNDLLCNEGDIISAEPARRIKEMARIAKDNDDLIELLENDDLLYIKRELLNYSEFNEKLEEYLDKFSGRCLEELKLETLTLKENPRSLYTSIATFAKRMKKGDIQELDGEQIRRDAEEKVREQLKLRPFKRLMFNYTLKQARYTVKNRENLRFERTRLFGRVREIFLRIGYILASMNVIEEKRDIFYLEVNEILYYIDGKSTTNNLKELIAIRKEQYKKYEEELPDERFYSYGAVNVGNDYKHTDYYIENGRIISNNSDDKDESINQDEVTTLKGIGASPGEVTGKVRVIHNPANAKINEGEILVAEFTDPGWIMLFPSSSAILVERGSLLSHSAIVSRELGIPAVVGISGLINSVHTGDTVKMNGITGTVEIIERADDKKENEKLEDKKHNKKKEEQDKKQEDTGAKEEVTSKEKKEEVIEEKKQEEVVKKSKKDISIILDDNDIPKTIREFVEYIKRYDGDLYEDLEGLSYKDAYLVIRNIAKLYDEKHGKKVRKIGLIANNDKIYELNFLAVMYAGYIVCPIENEIVKEKYKIDVIVNKEEQEAFYNKAITEDEVEYSFRRVYENDACVMFTTSGTTMLNKGIELTYKNIFSNMYYSSKILNLNENDVVGSVLPEYHVLEGLFSLLNSIYSGCKRVHIDGVQNIISSINKKNITFMCATPSVYKYLEHDLSKLNSKPLFFSAGSKLSIDLQEKYISEGFTLIQGYGLTETSSAISVDERKNIKIGSSGKLLENVELKIENSDKKGIGEIFVKSDNVFPCKDEWFDTGDLGKLEDGKVFVLGRTKDVIVLENGKKVFPQELEEMINKIRGVKESLVYGDKLNSGKVIISAKIIADESSKDYVENQVMLICQDLEPYKQIRNIFFTDKIEKNEFGKIIRDYDTQDEKESKKDSTIDFQKELLTDEKEQVLKSIIVDQIGIAIGKIDDESDLRFDLGCDSLDKAEIIAKYESKLNTIIPKEEYPKINKVKDIIKY